MSHVVCNIQGQLNHIHSSFDIIIVVFYSYVKDNKPQNMFDELQLSLVTNKATTAQNELDVYLGSEPEPQLITDPIEWWNGRRRTYPNLSRMAIDYLSIPATSVEVERLFSRGRLLLSHVRNRLSTQTSRALLCLGPWSLNKFVHDDDVRKVAAQVDVGKDEKEPKLRRNWDRIIA